VNVEHARPDAGQLFFAFSSRFDLLFRNTMLRKKSCYFFDFDLTFRQARYEQNKKKDSYFFDKRLD